MQIKMVTVALLVVLVLFLYQVGAYKTNNPNNYFGFSINSIKEELTKKISVTYYDVIILKTHINVNSRYVQSSIDEEIQKLIVKEEELKCRQFLSSFKERLSEDCHMQNDFDSLVVTRLKFNQLKEVACLTEEICEDLNPLKAQENDLEKCELAKIADLRLQIIIVSEEFEKLKRKLFEDHDRCVRNLLSTAYSELADIVYGTCKKLNLP